MPTSKASLPISDEEYILIKELLQSGTKFLVVGMGAAVLQGANVSTQDLDLWFPAVSDPRISEAASKAGGILIWRSDPPAFAGPGLENLDIVFHCHGLNAFDVEYESAIDVPFAGMILKVLPLRRVIASKKAAGRPKDKASLPVLRTALKAIEEKS